MTTTITVETHSWPVAVTINQEHNHYDEKHISSGYSSSTQFVPKNSKQQFHISSTASASFRELPEDAEGLGPDPRNQSLAACASIG